jgi:hypothetical protein
MNRKKICIWCKREYEGKAYDICCGDKKCVTIQSMFPKSMISKIMAEETISVCERTHRERFTHHWDENKNWVENEERSRDWNQDLVERVHDKFYQLFGEHKCFECGKLENDNINEIGNRLHIHHVDYDVSMGCDNPNLKLVPLCNSCHGKTNDNRNYWKWHFKEKLDNIPNFDGICWTPKK